MVGSMEYLNDRFQTNYERENGLLIRALIGLLYYLFYMFLIVLGWAWFVSGINKNGEEFDYLLNLIHMDNLNWLWLFLLLPILALITIVSAVGAIFVIIYLIGNVVEYFKLKTKDKLIYEDVLDEKGNIINRKYIGRVERDNIFVNMRNLIRGIKDKYCPVIEWK